MLDFLQGIANFITMLVELIGTVIESIFTFIANIPAWITWMLSAFAYVPPTLFPFLITGALLSIIMFVIIGRSGNGG